MHPIVTICIYYGEDEWDGPRSLIDMLDIKIYKKMEASREDTIKNIMEDFSLDKEVADKYVEEYY